MQKIHSDGECIVVADAADICRTNVSVQIDVLIKNTSDGTHAGGAFVASNVNIGGCWSMYANGVYLWVSVDSRLARLTGNQSQ